MRETVGGVRPVNLRAFQPCDVRGVYGTGPEAEVSPVLAFRIGRSLARRTPEDRPLLLAGDGRESTPALLGALEQGAGRPCLNLGVPVPTPLAWLARQLSAAHTSAIVTASHNPAKFNGVKIQIGETPITPGELAAIRDDVARMAGEPASGPIGAGAERDGEGEARLRETWHAYRAAVADAFGAVRGARIALDCMHGSYAGYAREALEGQGYVVSALRDEVHGDFGGAVPNPADDRNLAELALRVREGGFAFGAALDGDGDRVRFVDETGAPVDNGTVLVLLVRDRLQRPESRKRRVVVYDQKIRLAVADALRSAGAEPVREKSGHTFIRARMLAESAVLGGENSGHFFWGAGGPYPVAAGDCGLFAVFALGDLLQRAERPLSELCAAVPDSPFYTDDIRGLRYEGDRDRLLREVAAGVERGAYEVSTEDGVRIERPGAFALLRASVTESDMLTACLDAADWPGLHELASALAGLLPADAKEIGRTILARVEDRRP